MDKYIDSVDIWTNDLVNQRITDKRIKDALFYQFDYSNGDETVLSTLIDNMKNSFSDPEQREVFGSMLSKTFDSYLKYMSIDRETFTIEESEYDKNYSTLTFEFAFDNEKALAKAEKAFRKLQKENKLFPYMEEIPVGSKGVFISPYKQYAEYNGKSFIVVGVIDKDDDTHDISEVGTMYKIQFKDKSIIEAWPEEMANVKVHTKANLGR